MRGRHPAFRRYGLRMAAVAALYITGIMAAVKLLPDNAHASPASIAIALLPGIAVLGFIWTLGRLLVELDDEYLRLLTVRQFMVATGLLLSLASIWGILELFTDVPRVPVFYAFPVWCAGLAAGSLYNKLTLGDGGGCA